jgi:hypothetical protein
MPHSTAPHSILPANNMDGELPDAIGDLVDVTNIYVEGNPKLHGPLPLSMARWTKLTELFVHNCGFNGGYLPALHFSQMKYCILDRYAYACPWPPSAAAKCTASGEKLTLPHCVTVARTCLAGEFAQTSRRARPALRARRATPRASAPHARLAQTASTRWARPHVPARASKASSTPTSPTWRATTVPPGSSA